MSSQNLGSRATFKSAADYSAKQFYIVKLTAADTVTLASAATDVILGTITNKPAAATGASTTVQLRGSGEIGQVILGGTVSAVNARLTADSNGKAVVTTTTGNQVFGLALETGVAGDVVRYLSIHNIVA